MKPVHATIEWMACNDAQRVYLRWLALLMYLPPADSDPGPILVHVDHCLSCRENMRVMNATSVSVSPPRVGHFA